MGESMEEAVESSSYPKNASEKSSPSVKAIGCAIRITQDVKWYEISEHRHFITNRYLPVSTFESAVTNYWLI